jgi:hypothetical protein
MNEVHQAQQKKFLQTHHPHSGKIKLYQCISTDEGGIKNNIARRYAKSQIHGRQPINRNRAPIRQVAGSSFRSNKSKAYNYASKHASYKTNIILSLSLDPDRPVVHYELHDKTVDEESYAEFIYTRQDIHGIDYDLIDRAFFHRGLHPVGYARGFTTDAYFNSDIIRDFISTGWPQYNPVEQAIGWIKQYIANQAPRYNFGDGWNRIQFRNTIHEAVRHITPNLVKA